MDKYKVSDVSLPRSKGKHVGGTTSGAERSLQMEVRFGAGRSVGDGGTMKGCERLKPR